MGHIHPFLWGQDWGIPWCLSSQDRAISWVTCLSTPSFKRWADSCNPESNSPVCTQQQFKPPAAICTKSQNPEFNSHHHLFQVWRWKYIYIESLLTFSPTEAVRQHFSNKHRKEDQNIKDNMIINAGVCVHMCVCAYAFSMCQTQLSLISVSPSIVLEHSRCSIKMYWMNERKSFVPILLWGWEITQLARGEGRIQTREGLSIKAHVLNPLPTFF